jgi:hypothetical protein
VTSRRTHGPPEDVLDDWGSCEFLSSFRQNATSLLEHLLGSSARCSTVPARRSFTRCFVQSTRPALHWQG